MASIISRTQKVAFKPTGASSAYESIAFNLTQASVEHSKNHKPDEISGSPIQTAGIYAGAKASIELNSPLWIANLKRAALADGAITSPLKALFQACGLLETDATDGSNADDNREYNIALFNHLDTQQPKAVDIVCGAGDLTTEIKNAVGNLTITAEPDSELRTGFALQGVAGVINATRTNADASAARTALEVASTQPTTTPPVSKGAEITLQVHDGASTNLLADASGVTFAFDLGAQIAQEQDVSQANGFAIPQITNYTPTITLGYYLKNGTDHSLATQLTISDGLYDFAITLPASDSGSLTLSAVVSVNEPAMDGGSGIIRETATLSVVATGEGGSTFTPLTLLLSEPTPTA